MITSEDAMRIARDRAKEHGWGLAEPISVETRRAWSGRIKSYEIHSNPRLRGTKARFTIDAETGAILAEGYLPR